METGVKLTDLVEKMNLKNLTPGVDLTDHAVYVPDVNRPALQLTDSLIILILSECRLLEM